MLPFQATLAINGSSQTYPNPLDQCLVDSTSAKGALLSYFPWRFLSHLRFGESVCLGNSFLMSSRNFEYLHLPLHIGVCLVDVGMCYFPYFYTLSRSYLLFSFFKFDFLKR